MNPGSNSELRDALSALLEAKATREERRIILDQMRSSLEDMKAAVQAHRSSLQKAISEVNNRQLLRDRWQDSE